MPIWGITSMNRFQRGSTPFIGLLLAAMVAVLMLRQQLHGGSPKMDIGLVHAKYALLSYATNYQDLYHAYGAGPGHLPCPDTDFEQRNIQIVAVRDGPNPPCGNELWAAGLLPRKIQFDDERYYFQTTNGQRYWYVVSSQFINNPTNRVINFHGLQDSMRTPMASVVSLPAHLDKAEALGILSELHKNPSFGDTGYYPSVSFAVVNLFPEDLIYSVSSRVAEWFVTALNRAAAERCGHQPNSCYPYQQVRCIPGSSLPYQYQGEHLLRLLDSHPANESCDSQERLKKVQPKNRSSIIGDRHWFFRNQWLGSFVLVVQQMCIDADMKSCRFRFSSIDVGETSGISIELSGIDVE